MSCIVAKFGGSSLASAEQFRKVKHILSLDARRLFVVPSAPGKRFPEDDKVTDLLIACHNNNMMGYSIDEKFTKITERFQSIAKELALTVNLDSELAEIKQNILNGASLMYTESRGEYLNGLLLANYLGYTFFDPARAIYFSDNGKFDSELSNRVLAESLSALPNAIIPGFYGRKQNGQIQTFSRGGSDITGAVVARALCADVYENWTDVSGFLMADPCIVKNPLEIRELTYKELRELCYMGANVLHEDAIYPVQRARISTNIRNTNFPEHPGTLILHTSSASEKPKKNLITGIAGKAGFDIITIEKSMMNSEIGFGMRVLQALYEFNLSFEHLPTGIDSICVVVNHKDFEPHEEAIRLRITELVQPDSIDINRNIAMVATVGRGMISHYGTAARLFQALSREQINIKMIDQGSSELSIIVGVDSNRFADCIRAIYQEFVE